MTRTQERDTGILVEGLVRRFGDLTAIDHLDLEVAPGEIYGFLGPNGAGKSTTVRVLCTLLAPSGGRAVVAGYDVATEADRVRLRIGAALQEAALDPRQTGAELLRLQGRLYGLTPAEVERRLAELSTLIELGEALDRGIATYSGGMKRRLDLAAALIHNPCVLFLDEPTSGLDPASRAKVWDEVGALNEQLGMTIFLTTQYLEEADALAHRVGIFDHGRLVAEGTPDQLKRTVGSDVLVARIDGEARPAVQAVSGLDGVTAAEMRGDELLIAADNGAAVVGSVAVALEGCGVRVRELTLRRPSLDDVFLELTGGRIDEEVAVNG